ncbi:MAG TPA: 2OG-Fe(II) oxygenase [Gemmataceae bacterium]|nr:2OG-Fe(II) oxygenase [Gemmataceae bacterium]
MIAKNFEPGFANATVARLERELVRTRAPADSKEPSTEKSKKRDELPEKSSPPAILKRNPNYTYGPSRIPHSNVIHTSDRSVHVLARFAIPDIVLFADVLSDAECSELIQRSRSKLKRSTLFDRATGKAIVAEGRTSYGVNVGVEEDEFIARIDRRLSELLRWPVDHGEGLQVLRYAVGQQYRPHFDFFLPGSTGSAINMARGGQRVATLVTYLNDVEDGGETIFPEIGLSVLPRRGHAVYFAYYDFRNQTDPLTHHGGAPVQQGEKWIATKWLRERPWTRDT